MDTSRGRAKGKVGMEEIKGKNRGYFKGRGRRGRTVGGRKNKDKTGKNE